MPTPRPTHLARLARWAALLVPVVLVGVVAAARQAEVVASGRLLPFFETYDQVARVRLLGVELYVDTSSGLNDLLTVSALATIAVLLLAGAASARHDPALRRTFLAAAFGAAYLTADDLLAVHETVGHNLGALAELPLVDHPDDVIMALYGVVVCAFGWRHRDLLRGRARRWFVAAALAGGAAVAHDLLPLHYGAAEEVLEVVAAGALVLATGVLVGEHTGVRAAYAAASSGYRRRIA